MTLNSVRVSTLANGLRVATDTIPHVESVTLGMWIGAGTRDERPEVNGVAHMLEHMAFKGTRRRSAQAIAEEVEAVGGYMNAYTSREQTAYYCRMMKDDLPLALDVIADILQHSIFDPEELQRERTVILQEIGQVHDTPDDIIFDHFQETAFPDQALGWPVLGRAEIVADMPRDALQSFIANHYRPDRMVLSVAGKVDHDAVVEAASRAFVDLADRGSSVPQSGRYVGGDFRGTSELEQAHLCLGFPGVGYHDDAYYAQSVLASLLGSGMSSRLFQEVREKRGLCYSIHTFVASYRETGLFGVYTGTGAEDLDELVPVVAGELEAVTRAVDQREVDRARAQLKASMIMGLESTTGRAEHLGQQVLIYDRPIMTEEFIAKLDAVTVDAVIEIAARLFTNAPPTVTALGPIQGLEPYDRLAARFVA